MPEQFVTAFWLQAYRSLPAAARPRYLAQVQAAERWELRLDALIEGWTRAKNALARLFAAPGNAH